MTELQKVLNQLNKALAELMSVNLDENELLYDYIFEAHRLVKNLTIPDVVVPKGTLCDVCGSDDIIEAPSMGVNCNSCNPL